MYTSHTPIKQWAEADRPREKLLHQGRTALSIAELFAVILGSGTKNQSAMDLAKNMMEIANNDLSVLARWGVHDFNKVRGIGKVKALQIISALELGRRRSVLVATEKPVITSSSDVYGVIREKLMDKPHEEFWIVILNRKNAVIDLCRISSGGVAGTVVDPKIIFKEALDRLASGIILVHNHPSGNRNPSEEDIRLTKVLVEAGDLLSIKVLDHLIFTDEGYFSFIDEGRM